MPFSFETFAWAVSALFQLLTVCAYLLSFPDVDGVDDHLPDIDGVDDQLPDMPEVIQDSAIEMKITYSGIIFVFGFYGAFVEPRDVAEESLLYYMWSTLLPSLGVPRRHLYCGRAVVTSEQLLLTADPRVSGFLTAPATVSRRGGPSPWAPFV